jgi:ATP-binding cassette subfamily F protein 3
MALLSLNDAHFDYGREKILRGATIALQPGVKYALVGANGAGKTTLLAALAGELELPGGVRQKAGSASVRLLRQETSLAADRASERLLLPTVANLAFRRERDLEADLIRVAASIVDAGEADHDGLVAEQGRLQDEYERLDGYTVRSRLESALRGVGLLPETWDRPVGLLSGGERRRAALASVLLAGGDLLLLDEPTNHLDLDSCEWLEGFLNTYPGAAVIVSHDRQFLDRTATKTLHLDRGRLVSYSGNYSFFDEQSRLRYTQDLNAWQRQQTKMKQTEEYIRRNIEGQKTKQAQSRRKQMDKVEKIEKPTAEPGLFRFDLKPARPSGGTALETENIGKSYGARALVAGLDLYVSRGDRVGIIGPNGCGKSTLLKMMAGRVVPDAGRVVIGHNVDMGFYDQELSGVSDHNTVITEMASVDPAATLGELRSFLGAFGFGEDLFDRQVSRLSGGERGRLSLMRLIKEGHNTLLLDEPTNHLDIRSRESLEAALKKYTGTMIVVSHDRRFLDKIVERLIVFPGTGETADGQVRQFDGNYTEWVRKRSEENRTQVPSGGAGTARVADPEKAPRSGGMSKNEQKRRVAWMAEAEVAIEALEAEKEALIAEMWAPDQDNDRRVTMGRRCQEIETKLEKHLADWEGWGLEIEEGTTE